MDLVITHITDIHIKTEEDLYILMERTDSIVGAIAEVVRNENETTLLICVTGDVAYSGTEEQYTIAELFFDDIYEKIKERYIELDIQFVFVPGNHDCDFENEMNTVRTTVIKAGNANLDDAVTMKLCTSIQEKYFEFVDRYMNRNLAVSIRKNSIFTENILLSNKLGKYRIKLPTMLPSSVQATTPKP